MDCKFKADFDYPELSINKIDKREVALLMPAYGGKKSETTAIMEYAFQSYVLKTNYPEISSCLKRIAIAEMKHHELLADAIIAFGGIPYIGGNNYFWQGGFVNYSTDVKTIINRDVTSEKEAIAYYKEIIRLSENESLKKLIGRIILDEAIHIETLNAIKNQLLNA